MLGLCCCKGFSLVVASGGYSRGEVQEPLSVVTSLVAEPGLWGARASGVASPRLSSCGTWA